MGTRAAVMTAAAAAAAGQVPPPPRYNKYGNSLFLVSYPLDSSAAGQGSIVIRDQKFLISLPPSMKVIFLGDRDSICDLERLEEVRAKMACKIWRVVLSGADHGMKLRSSPNYAGKADDVVQQSGEVVAARITAESDEGKREGRIVLNEVGEVHWSGWFSGCSGFPSSQQNEENNNTDTSIAGEPNNRKAQKRCNSSKTDDGKSAGGGRVKKKGRKH